MLKFIGAALVVTACGLAGTMVAVNYDRRPKQLRALIGAIQALETEITYAATPLPDAWERVGRQTAQPVGAIFTRAREVLAGRDGCSAAEAWRKGLEDSFQETALTRQDMEVLLELGNCLGVSYRDDQVKHLRLTKENLRQLEVAAQEEAARQVKTWRYFGVLGGLVVALLLY